MRKLLILSVFIFVYSTLSAQQQEIRLWKEHGQRYNTTLYCYHAPDSINTGVAVIVCPGGSYRHLMGIKTEGFEVAEWLNSQGINAYVLRYRVGKYGYHHPAMIEDFQLAIQFLRENAERWHLDAHKIGAMGFSAGGHLVTMAGVFADQDFLKPYRLVQEYSNRPDFVVPVYPVVSMQDSIAHQRSRKNLLTQHYTKEQQDQFSMELQIPSNMPPTFLVTAIDDPVVMYQNSVNLDKALTAKKIPHVFKLYNTGGHGYGMSEEIAPEAGRWKYDFVKWLKEIGF
ncbi:MAG: alpha/beta hydrolase [Bacteroidales bacterium]|nr:alpha/beta hydrolase [Bacteroidales bacterium]